MSWVYLLQSHVYLVQSRAPPQKKSQKNLDFVCNALLYKKRLAYTTRVGYESGYGYGYD